MSTWRERFTVHPAADVFPMMSDDELQKLGEDIKANGLQSPIICQDTPGPELILLDGRNRLMAMQRVGLYDGHDVDTVFVKGDPVSVVVSANIRRRHLSKQEQADLIVAARQALKDPSPSWRRGYCGNPVKAAAVANAKTLGIGKRTVERAFEKAT